MIEGDDDDVIIIGEYIRNRNATVVDSVLKALYEIFPNADRNFINIRYHNCKRAGLSINQMVRSILDSVYPKANVRRHDAQLIMNRIYNIVLSDGGVSRNENNDIDSVNAVNKNVFGSVSTYFNDIASVSNVNNDDFNNYNIPSNGTAINNETKHADSTDNTEHMISFILELLPDADPYFIKEKCRQMNGNYNEIQAFLSNCIDKKNYQRKSNTEPVDAREDNEINKYTEMFNIDDFLKIFPDPVNYFRTVKKNGKTHEMCSKVFLRRRYRLIRTARLDGILEKYNYNLTLACEELDKGNEDNVKNLRRIATLTLPTTKASIPFYQEVAFIQHQEEICTYLEMKKQEKEELFRLAKERNELIECPICCDAEVIPQDVSSCPEGHMYCNECINRGVEIDIGAGKTSFKCFDANCGKEFSLKVLQDLLAPKVFTKMLLRRQYEEVQSAGIEGLEACPFCTFATIPAVDDKVFHCLNPECKIESCRLCREKSHIPLRCHEVEKQKDVKARTYIEDRMTEALVRECWKCHKRFVKEDGCNKMTCECGAHSCYLCRQKVTDYSHFEGQGQEPNKEKCPLFSSNYKLHIQAVKDAVNMAKLDVTQNNPDAKFSSILLICLCPLYSNNDKLHDHAVKDAGKRAKLDVTRNNPDVKIFYDPTDLFVKRKKPRTSKSQ